MLRLRRRPGRRAARRASRRRREEATVSPPPARRGARASPELVAGFGVNRHAGEQATPPPSGVSPRRGSVDALLPHAARHAMLLSKRRAAERPRRRRRNFGFPRTWKFAYSEGSRTASERCRSRYRAEATSSNGWRFSAARRVGEGERVKRRPPLRGRTARRAGRGRSRRAPSGSSAEERLRRAAAGDPAAAEVTRDRPFKVCEVGGTGGSGGGGGAPMARANGTGIRPLCLMHMHCWWRS